LKPQFLFAYWFRYLGWGLVFVHIPIAMFGRMKGRIDPLDNLPGNTGLFAGEHLFFMGTTLLMSLGLFFVAFARERIEDEQIWHIRLTCLRGAIFVNYLILIISLVFVRDTAHILELNLWAPLIFFIIRFRWVIFRLNRSLSQER
jgi:hypothetical protein